MQEDGWLRWAVWTERGERSVRWECGLVCHLQSIESTQNRSSMDECLDHDPWYTLCKVMNMNMNLIWIESESIQRLLYIVGRGKISTMTKATCDYVNGTYSYTADICKDEVPSTPYSGRDLVFERWRSRTRGHVCTLGLKGQWLTTIGLALFTFLNTSTQRRDALVPIRLFVGGR